MSQHDMGPSTLNHGLTQCRKCYATDREIHFVLGPICSVADPEPAPIQLTPSQHAIIMQANWFAGYFQRQMNKEPEA